MDVKIVETLVRINVGLEDVEDLIGDFRQAFLKISAELKSRDLKL